MKNNNFYSWLDQLVKNRLRKTVSPLKSEVREDLMYNEMLNDPTYNYRTFYNLRPDLAQQILDDSPYAHFSDIGKTMYHPTFSNESLYSGYVNEFNPLGITGGSWNEFGNEYTPSKDQLENYWNYDTTRRYLDEAEDRPVKINIPKYKAGKGSNRSMYYDYVATLGPSLYKSIKRRGIKNADNFYDFAMKQMGSESTFGTSRAVKEGFNFGGVKPHTKYVKYKSVDDYTEKWVDMMMRMYPNAITATTPEEYVNALSKNVEGHSYFEDDPKTYLRNIKNAKTLDKYMQLYRKHNNKLFDVTAGVVDGNLTQPIYDLQGNVAKTIEVPIQPDIRTVLNPQIQIPLKPQLYPTQLPKMDYLDSDGNPINYNKGKDGIHINPANRGKFNATKKRTGKSTEELAHSKNPLTRKRAIFALNARKWKH